MEGGRKFGMRAGSTAGQMRMKLGSDVLVPFSWSHYAASFNIHATGGFLGTRRAV